MRVAPWLLVLLCCVASPCFAARQKLDLVKKKELQQITGTRKKDKKGFPAAKCGAIVQLLHPNMSNDPQVQIKDQAEKAALSKELLAVKRELGEQGKADVVTFAKFAWKKDKLWLEYHTEGIFYTDWGGRDGSIF